MGFIVLGWQEIYSGWLPQSLFSLCFLKVYKNENPFIVALKNFIDRSVNKTGVFLT